MAKITRREVLKGGALSVLLVPLAYLVRVSIGGYTLRDGLKILSSKEAAILESVAEVIIPAENELNITIHDVELVKHADEFINVMPSYTQSRIQLVFWLVEHVLPLRKGHFKKFTRLTIDQRYRIFKALEHSPWTASRAFFRALKGLVLAVFYNHPIAVSKIGYVYKCSV